MRFRFEPLAVVASALLISWSAFDLRAQRQPLEGDELVHVVLTEQLERGTYTLRGSPLLVLPGFSHYLYDRAVHYNPPLYDALLLAVREVFSAASYVYVSVLASLLSACLVYRLTRRRTSPLGAAFAMLVFLGCPIVYLVTCRIWAEPVLALLICLIAECCERERLRAAGLWTLGLLLAAAALVKISILFVLPGLCWQVLRDRRRLAIVAGVPVAISALWLAYVYYANAASPPAVAPADDRFQNPFVAQQAGKHALSFFILPLLLNPGYAFAWLGLRRELWPYALSVSSAMLAFSSLAWFGAGTYHTKYISIVLPLLAVLAGSGFEELGRRLGARRRVLACSASAAIVALVLIAENTVHRRIWIAEVDPSLYLGRQGHGGP